MKVMEISPSTVRDLMLEVKLRGVQYSWGSVLLHSLIAALQHSTVEYSLQVGS